MTIQDRTWTSRHRVMSLNQDGMEQRIYGSYIQEAFHRAAHKEDTGHCSTGHVVMTYHRVLHYSTTLTFLLQLCLPHWRILVQRDSQKYSWEHGTSLLFFPQRHVLLAICKHCPQLPKWQSLVQRWTPHDSSYMYMYIEHGNITIRGLTVQTYLITGVTTGWHLFSAG